MRANLETARSQSHFCSRSPVMSSSEAHASLVRGIQCMPIGTRIIRTSVRFEQQATPTQMSRNTTSCARGNQCLPVTVTESTLRSLSRHVMFARSRYDSRACLCVMAGSRDGSSRRHAACAEGKIAQPELFRPQDFDDVR